MSESKAKAEKVIGYLEGMTGYGFPRTFGSFTRGDFRKISDDITAIIDGKEPGEPLKRAGREAKADGAKPSAELPKTDAVSKVTPGEATAKKPEPGTKKQ